MTLHEAFIKAKTVAEMEGHTLLVSCGDYGDFWGFGFMPEGFLLDKPSGGGADTTVNKETGEIGVFIPPMDLDLFSKRKPIPIDQFTEYNVAI
jgi:hypothetical protein